VPDAIHLILAHLSLEGVFHLARGAAELKRAAAAGDFIHVETVILKPPYNRVDILLGGTEALAELLGRQPFLKMRGCGIVLVGQQLLERRLLFRAAGKLHLDSLHGQVRGGAAEVASGSCERVSGAAQAGNARAIDALADARPLLGREHTGEGKSQ
jgi:hypothetical protein